MMDMHFSRADACAEAEGIVEEARRKSAGVSEIVAVSPC
jgi:hypothetical protein